MVLERTKRVDRLARFQEGHLTLGLQRPRRAPVRLQSHIELKSVGEPIQNRWCRIAALVHCNGAITGHRVIIAGN